jgi:hypothetical protein
LSAPFSLLLSPIFHTSFPLARPSPPVFFLMFGFFIMGTACPPPPPPRPSPPHPTSHPYLRLSSHPYLVPSTPMRSVRHLSALALLCSALPNSHALLICPCFTLLLHTVRFLALRVFPDLIEYSILPRIPPERRDQVMMIVTCFCMRGCSLSFTFSCVHAYISGRPPSISFSRAYVADYHTLSLVFIHALTIHFSWPRLTAVRMLTRSLACSLTHSPARVISH